MLSLNSGHYKCTTLKMVLVKTVNFQTIIKVYKKEKFFRKFHFLKFGHNQRFIKNYQIYKII